MRKLAKKANFMFNFLVLLIPKRIKYNYTMTVSFEGLKLVMRPFIFSEILMVSGSWEPYVKAKLDSLLAQDDVIVDVGANIGIYAIPYAKRVKRVIAFEPHPKTANMLEQSIRLNDLQNVSLIKKAVGESSFKAQYGLSVVPMNSGITTPHKVDSTIEVETVDLDTELASEDRVDWILVDVENFEVSVLKGAVKTLAKHSPKIIIEVDHGNVRAVEHLLENQSYSILNLYNIYYFAHKAVKEIR
jgi:FkbM family methyltransferase